jgi:carboxylesterase
MTASRVAPGAQPFSFEGGPIGVLLVHGFSGNPSSWRKIGEWLAARGHAVECPLWPGHGTRWEDLRDVRWTDWVEEEERALRQLAARTGAVVAAGLSAGGGMSLLLGARHPDLLRGVVTVNPYVFDRRILAFPYIWPVIPPQKGVGNDIKKPAENELPYDRLPARAIGEVAKLLAAVRRSLRDMRLPLLVFHAPEDHVVPKGNHRIVMQGAGSEEKELVLLPNSYHVATLDHDAEEIFERIHEFAEAHAPARG